MTDGITVVISHEELLTRIERLEGEVAYFKKIMLRVLAATTVAHTNQEKVKVYWKFSIDKQTE
jgi:hypothetical protein